jgi:hypothetical protein
MSVRLLSGCFAVALIGGAVVSAQAPQQAPPAPPQAQQAAPDQQKSAQPATITVAGCVQKETDVLKRPAAAGDVGMSDEFVLTQSALNPPAAAAEPAAAPKPDEPAGTSGTTGPGKVFRVTGDKESELKNYVGQRVEITGAFKHEADAKASATTAAADLTPDKTPEITIASIRPASGSCPAMKGR